MTHGSAIAAGIGQFGMRSETVGEDVMRLLLAIGTFALFLMAIGPTRAEVAEPSTVSALTALCKTDTKKCEDQIGLIIMTGVQAQKLPTCTSQLDLTELTGKIVGWWQAHPEQAGNSVVLGMLNALNDLKPC